MLFNLVFGDYIYYYIFAVLKSNNKEIDKLYSLDIYYDAKKKVIVLFAALMMFSSVGAFAQRS